MNNACFFLLGRKGYRVLSSLFDEHKEIIDSVVIGEDAGVDDDFSKETQAFCAANGIKCMSRQQSDEYLQKFDGYVIAIGWRWLLPERRKIIVIHDSLLPEYRGFAPLVNQLINGEDIIGATAIFASSEYDKGPILLQESISISYPIKIFDAIEVIGDTYCVLVRKLLRMISNDEPMNAIEQDESKATYSLWRDDNDYWVNWCRSADEIVRFIDAVGPPYSGARCRFGNEMAIIQSAAAVTDVVIVDRASAIGKVLKVEAGHPVVVCAKGLIKINSLTSIDGKHLLPLKKFRTRFGSA